MIGRVELGTYVAVGQYIYFFFAFYQHTHSQKRERERESGSASTKKATPSSALNVVEQFT